MTESQYSENRPTRFNSKLGNKNENSKFSLLDINLLMLSILHFIKQYKIMIFKFAYHSIHELDIRIIFFHLFKKKYRTICIYVFKIKQILVTV